MSKEYTSDNIKVLSDLEHIRTRKGLYIGEKGPEALFNEIFDNAIDEVQAGYSEEMVISVDTKNNAYTIRDYGRGIPHGMKKLESGEEKETLEVLLSKANSGGKFDNSAYLYSSGLHGVGLTVTRALSEYLVAKTIRKKKMVMAECNDKDDLEITYWDTDEHDGTEMMFIPSPKYFNNCKISIDYIKDRCKIASALGFRARLIVDGQEINTDATIFDLIKEESSISVYTNIPPIEVTAKSQEKMKVALRYTSDTNDRYFGYTNLLHNYLGGTHVQELSKTISNTWKEFIEKHKNLKPVVELHNGDYLVGLRAVCAVFISQTEFSSQTKEKLVVNRKYFEELMGLFSKQFYKYLEDNILIAQQLMKRFEEYRVAQNNLLSRKEISSLIKINTDDGDNIRRRSVVSKLVECTSKKREGTELFLCLAGDVRVKLLNGKSEAISDLVGQKDIWAYSVNENGQFVPTKILDVFETRKVNKLLRIHLSDGSHVDCTPEHRFMDRDTLNWMEARYLIPGQSLLSTKTKLIDGYVNVWIPMKYENKYSKNRKSQGHWELLHRRVASHLGLITDFNGEDFYQVHHKDHNRINNDPSNYEILLREDHFKHHALYNIESGICKEGFDNMSFESRKRMQEGVYQRTSEGIERQKLAVKASWEKDRHNPKRTWARYNGTTKFWEDVERNKLLHSQRMKNRWQNLSEEERQHERDLNRQGTLRRKRIQCIHMGQELLENGYELTSENWKTIVWKNGYPSLNKAIEYFGSVEALKEEILNYNLKVIVIEELNFKEEIPVYCLTVDNPTHAFVLDNGLVTHNCEGNSAMGPFLFTRNKETQAVLPLRGKILNVTCKTVKEAIQNTEICDIANSIGCGIGTGCDAKKSRYDSVILAADADIDGAHITSLLASLFINLFPDMVKQGKVKIALPPLYCWGKDKKSFGWANDIKDVPKNVSYTRFKGLGAMENDQLKYFCVDPETRNEVLLEYPSDIEEFNRIVGSSQGKNTLLKELGILEEGN